MTIHVLRLVPKQEIKKALESFIQEKNISAAIILTCVGSISEVTLRLADENIIKTYKKKFEIVSLVGTMSKDGVHVHISLADAQGKCRGGHLKEAFVYTTAEIAIKEIEEIVFSREYDPQTGFKELIIKEKN